MLYVRPAIRMVHVFCINIIRAIRDKGNVMLTEKEWVIKYKEDNFRE